MIKVKGNVLDVGGAVGQNKLIKFSLVDAKGNNTTGVLADGATAAFSKSVIIDPLTGYFEVDVYPNDSIVKETKYKVDIGNSTESFYIYIDSITAEVSISELTDLNHIPIVGYDTPDEGLYILTVDAVGTRSWTWYQAAFITSHTDLTNIGTNTHAQIDAHIANALVDADTLSPVTGVNKVITQSDISTLGGDGDMLKSVYDNSGTDGRVDDSDKVNGLTVLTAVPAGAVFTDTVYDDTAISAAVALNTAKISNVDHPLVETAVPLGAVFTDTTYQVEDGGLTQINFTPALKGNYDAAYAHSQEAHAPSNADNTALNQTSHADVLVDSDTVSPVTALNKLITEADVTGGGDMSKSTYDQNNSGVVDNAEKVNGLTVQTAVPIGAVFTDTVYNDTTLAAAVALNTAKVSNVDHPLVETTVPLGAVFTDTVYDDTTLAAAVALNTAKVSNVDHPLVETPVPLGALFTDTVYDDTDIQADVLGNTISIDVVIQSIANLASAQGSIINAVTPSVAPIPVAPTVSILDFTEVDASTDSTVFEFDDVANTITFKKAGAYNFTSSVTLESSTGLSRNITFELIDTSDDSVVTTQIAPVEVPSGKKANFPLNTLVVVDTVPLTVRVEASADGTGYALDSFNSVLVSMVNFIAELPTDILRDTDIGVTVEPYTDKAIVAENNAIDFTKKNFELTATAANITATGLTGTFPREGTILVHTAENITGWGVEFKFKTIPTDLTGDETFGYFIEDATNIWIGRVQ